MPGWVNAAVVVTAACGVSAMAMPLAALTARRWLLDEQDHRKRHGAAVPCTGGIAVTLGFAAACVAAYGLGAFAGGDRGPAFILATAIVFAVGLIEDLRGLPVAGRLLAQFAAAVLIVAPGHAISVLGTPFGPVELGTVAGFAVAVVWLVGITNAFNLLDGLDGLAAGVAAVIAGSLAVFAWLQGDPGSIAVGVALLGACAGFLPWNVRPARIFLGDCGALTIGFVLGWLSLTASLKSTTAIAVLVPFLLLGVPAIDTLLVMFERFREARGRGLWGRVRRVGQADRRHLHHLLLGGAGSGEVVLAIIALVLAFCLLALSAAVRASPYLVAATLLLEVAVVALLRRRRRVAAPPARDRAGRYRTPARGRFSNP